MTRVLALAVLAAGVWAASGAADGGGGPPGVSWGRPGILGPNGGYRYAAVPAGHGTVFEAVDARTGQVLRWTFLHGSYGIPMVAYDGTTGGLARSGNRLVLASLPTGSPTVTRFVVLDRGTFKVTARLLLHGNFAFDAISPGGSLMYLTQYFGAPSPQGQRYAVRALNLNTRRLYTGAIVDRREPDEKMTGTPMRRVESGGWAYTFYTRTSKSPFVHALDTVHRRAFCVDLPWRATTRWLGRVTMRVRGGKLLLLDGPRTRAIVDRRTFEVSPG